MHSILTLAIVVQYLDRLDKGEEENPNADASSQQLDESGSSKQPQKAHVDQLGRVYDAPNNGDKVEGVPGIFEICLNTIIVVRIL